LLKKSVIVLAVVAGILFLCTYPKVYAVRESTGGVLYWNSSEALILMQASSSGARMSYPRYALEPFLVSFGDVRSPDDERCSQAVVLRVTDKEVQRYDTDLYRYMEDPYCGMTTVVFEGSIYEGYLAEPKLWKWSGTDFKPATPEQLRDFGAARVIATVASSSHPWEFDNIDGWSMRQFGQTAPEYHLAFSGQPVTIIFHGETWPPQPLSVDLIRMGDSPQTIWSLDGRPHPVSRAEYNRAFEKH
jgi:hypothetical protein